MKSNTQISESMTSIDVAGFDEDEDGGRITLSQLAETKNFEKVSLSCKVLKIRPIMVVSGGKKKQDIVIGDGSGTGLVTLWEENVDHLEMGRSYELQV